METSGGNQASLAGRYATALFGLARDERQIDAVGRSLDALDQALARFEGIRGIRRKPADRPRGCRPRRWPRWPPQFGLDPITTKFVGVLAKNGRKRELRKIIRSFRRIAAEHRGETIAEVVTARPLNDDQVAALKAQLRTRAGGAEVILEPTVDPNILGGLVVKLGSEMIDASIRTKLNRLAAAMKG